MAGAPPALPGQAIDLTGLFFILHQYPESRRQTYQFVSVRNQIMAEWRISQVWKAPWEASGPISCSEQKQPDQGAQDLVQPQLEYCQEFLPPLQNPIPVFGPRSQLKHVSLCPRRVSLALVPAHSVTSRARLCPLCSPPSGSCGQQ